MRCSQNDDEFISDNFMADDFESGAHLAAVGVCHLTDRDTADAWRKEMQAELGLDGEDDVGDIGAEWEKDLADELDDLQQEIDADI